MVRAWLRLVVAAAERHSRVPLVHGRCRCETRPFRTIVWAEEKFRISECECDRCEQLREREREIERDEEK